MKKMESMGQMVRRGTSQVMKREAAKERSLDNTTNQTLSKVRVEVHLSNGIELGPTTLTDLAPDQTINVELSAAGQDFNKWSAHPEVGSSEHGGGEQHDEDGEHD
jgi:hypothetical protein